MGNQNNLEPVELQCSECGATVNYNDIKCPKCGADFQEDTVKLNENIKQGRRVVILIITSTLFVSLMVLIPNIIYYGTNKILTNIIRFGLTILLLVLFYRGVNATRIIMIVLFALAGLISFISGLSIIKSAWVNYLMVLNGVLYFLLAVMLAVLKPIKFFQESQREYYRMSKEN